MAITLGMLAATSAAQQNAQAEANAEMQEQQAQYNQRLAQREAARIEAETAESARRQREQSDYLKSQQRALLGKSGAAMSSGSPLALLGATAADEEMKIQDTHTYGAQAANQHREQAKMYGYQAGVARAQSPSGLSKGLNIANGIFNGAASGLSFAANAIGVGKSVAEMFGK